MLSKQQAKFIKSLQFKKYRKKEQTFVVEGAKSVEELLRSDFEVLMILCSEGFLQENIHFNSAGNYQTHVVTETVLQSLGSFQSNHQVLAVAAMKPAMGIEKVTSPFLLALDDIRDPGNLGTIIRIADWYGIHTLLASEETSEFYNPKVLQASMGSFTRVSLVYTSLEDFFRKNNHYKVYGAFPEGESIYNSQIYTPGILLLGNESHGIHSSLEPYIDYKIGIPRFGAAESLNVAVSTGILCDHFRRHNRF
ncbi:MAG: RNA methyltransferase [Cyclobacteriaceae bacterium]|nr:RNA methyltransferase [Cyclobacteriaceae bacterium]